MYIKKANEIHGRELNSDIKRGDKLLWREINKSK